MRLFRTLKGDLSLTRQTSSFSVTIPLAVVTRILDKNPYRLLYSIQNRNVAATDAVCISSSPLVTAGVFGTQEGQQIAAGQPMSDDTDQAAVYAIPDVAAVAAVTLAIVEISETPEPEKDNPIKRRSLRPEERRELRQEARIWG